MPSTALVKAREIARRSRARASVEIAKREHTMFAALASSILGVCEAKGHPLPEVVGLDGTLVVGTVSVLLADAAGGGFGRILQSVGDGFLSIGAYKMGRHFGGQAIKGVAGDIEAIEAVLSSS